MASHFSPAVSLLPVFKLVPVSPIFTRKINKIRCVWMHTHMRTHNMHVGGHTHYTHHNHIFFWASSHPLSSGEGLHDLPSTHTFPNQQIQFYSTLAKASQSRSLLPLACCIAELVMVSVLKFIFEHLFPWPQSTYFSWFVLLQSPLLGRWILFIFNLFHYFHI